MATGTTTPTTTTPTTPEPDPKTGPLTDEELAASWPAVGELVTKLDDIAANAIYGDPRRDVKRLGEALATYFRTRD